MGKCFFWRPTSLRATLQETVVQRSGDLQIEKHHAALGKTANMQCGPQKPTNLTPTVESSMLLHRYDDVSRLSTTIRRFCLILTAFKNFLALNHRNKQSERLFAEANRGKFTNQKLLLFRRKV